MNNMEERRLEGGRLLKTGDYHKPKFLASWVLIELQEAIGQKQ
ncbi:MAG: hypothetical protein Q8O48_12975 [Anaerolineales bacterium]|nr:hypothetical protein [Anaerolineales bacterium]